MPIEGPDGFTGFGVDGHGAAAREQMDLLAANCVEHATH